MAGSRRTSIRWLASLLTLFGWTLLAVAEAHPVHDALVRGSTAQALALLTQQPALVRSRDEYQCTPLHLAAQYGHVEVVRWLLAHKAAVNAQAYNRFTPLHLTSSGEVAKLLLKGGADPSLREAWGKTALQKAAQFGRIDVVNAIVDAGYPIDLVSALMLRRRDVAKKIIREQPGIVRRPPDLDDLWGDISPLGLAAAQGDKEMVLLLLKAGAPVNAGTSMTDSGIATPLCSAVWAGQVEMVEILCEAGADCNVIGGRGFRSLLDYASKHSDKRIVDFLLKHGARPDAQPLLDYILHGARPGAQPSLKPGAKKQ